jgi:translation initiation factor 1
MKLFRYRRPSLKTLLGVTKAKKRLKKQLGITALLKPVRWWPNKKRQIKRRLGYESPAGRLIRHGLPRPGGCLLNLLALAALGAAALLYSYGVKMRLFEGTPLDRPPRCERCGALEADCQCPPPPKPTLAPEKQTAALAVEKRKKGKTVTVVRGLAAEGNDLPALLGQLKAACGAGGAVKDDLLEIQGNHLARVREHLAGLGYRVRG